MGKAGLLLKEGPLLLFDKQTDFFERIIAEDYFSTSEKLLIYLKFLLTNFEIYLYYMKNKRKEVKKYE